ncbi:MAG: hypothetical protein KIT72_19510 [Polyangiaceae bacterium]|nr:hypothetical protein [Polyangiaceae bacterium]MCW5792609.1 hypothetical protein [Polyangiaceae bacterium]
MSKQSPLQIVKAKFESKEKLVAAVQALATEELFIDRVNETKGLAKVPNKKLLHLHEVLTTVKEQFGSRAKLVAAIQELEKRTKDDGFKTRLERLSTPALLDQHGAAKRRAGRAAKAKPPAPKKKVARSKKAQAKARA